MLLSSAFVLSLAGQTAFAADMSVYGPAIDYVKSRGLLPATEDGLFHSELPLSRLDLVHAVVHDVYEADVGNSCFDFIAPDLPATYSQLFRDVSRGAGFAREVCVGMFVGLLNGEQDGSFEPYWSANLAETAKVVSKAYGIAPFLGLYPQVGVPWHEPYWYALAREDAIPDSFRFERSHKVTRGEFAEILYRLRDEHPKIGFRSTYAHAYEYHQSTGGSAVLRGAGHAGAITESVLPAEEHGQNSILSHIEERRLSRLQKLADTTNDVSGDTSVSAESLGFGS